MDWAVRTEEGRSRLALFALIAAMVAAAALLLWEGRNLTFFIDEWSFGYLARHGMGASELLQPDNGHLAVVPVLATKVSLELFGADTTLPLRIVSLALHLAATGMLFVFLRSALGPLVALAPSILFLFLGAAGDAFVGSQSIPVQIAATSGVGALLALRSRSLFGDALAALLLVVGVASNGFALPFVIGAAAVIVLEPRWRRSRLWVVALPVIVYAAWWLGYGHDAKSGFDIDNVGGLPAFGFDSLAAVLAALTGLFTEHGVDRVSFALGPGQAVAGAVLLAALVLAVRGYRPPRAALPALLALLALWIATGLVAGPARQPAASRYVYSSALLLLIAAAPLIATVPGRRRASIAVAVVCAIALIPNLRGIHYSGNFFRTQASLNRAVLAAIDLTGPGAGASMRIETADEQIPGGVDDMRDSIQDYRIGRESYGTPAYSGQELAAADPGAREAADRLLARILGIEVERARGPAMPLRRDFSVVPAKATVKRSRACVEMLPSAAGASVTFELPPRGVRIRPAPGPTVPVALRRFGDSFSVDGGTVIGGVAADLRPRADPAAAGWQIQLPIQQRTLLCGV